MMPSSMTMEIHMAKKFSIFKIIVVMGGIRNSIVVEVNQDFTNIITIIYNVECILYIPVIKPQNKMLVVVLNNCRPAKRRQTRRVRTSSIPSNFKSFLWLQDFDELGL
jgi:hypothetical protein